MKNARIFLFGLLVWLVPFVVAFPFYGASGELNIDVFLFKSIMILTLVATTVFLSIYQLKKTKSATIKLNLIVALVWLAIPILLDFLVLIPISEMSAADYMKQIGLRYLVVPMIVVGQGWVMPLS